MTNFVTEDVSKAVVRLLSSNRFYAELILQMNRVISTKIPTLGVCIKDSIQLHINPEYFQSLSHTEQVAVLIHECDHILFDHIPRAKELAPEVYSHSKSEDIADCMIASAKHKVINIAADCAINPGIPGIMKGGMFPKKFNLEDGRLMEWYVEKLKNNEKVKEMTGIDPHELWSESEGTKEELREKIKVAVNSAVDKTKMSGHRLPSNIELAIQKLNHVPKDWKSDLKRFAARMQEIFLTSSRKKRNRRYGIQYPGVIKEERLHIGVAIDTSGSISDEALNQFFAEIDNMARYARITVVEADAEVHASYEYDPKKKYAITGRGGTAYQPALDYFTQEFDIDGLIYLGDMDNFDEKLTKPKYPVLWAIVGDQDPPAPWGSRTKIEVKQNG